MADICKKIVLAVKQKLQLIEEFENEKSVTKLAKDWGIGMHTVHDIKKNKIKLMEFVRDFASGVGPSNHKCELCF
jgi:hypothetical protein